MAWCLRRISMGLFMMALAIGTLACSKGDDASSAEAAHSEPPKTAKGAASSSPATDAHGKPAAKGAQPGTQAHWGYTGAAGQRNWSELDESNIKCVDGSAQSPINIAHPTLAPLTKITYEYNLAPVKVKNSGHTIQVDYLPASGYDGGKITLEGKVYKLRQLHFHRPSEHTINGRQFPMEVHLVHQADDQSLAVVGMVMDIGPHNGAFDAIWAAMPQKPDTAEVADKPFSANSLLPRSLATFRYPGSLTTPPCSEGVSWLLMKTPITIAQAQVQQFRKLFEFNSRYTQPLNGRDVYEDTSEP